MFPLFRLTFFLHTKKEVTRVDGRKFTPREPRYFVTRFLILRAFCRVVQGNQTADPHAAPPYESYWYHIEAGTLPSILRRLFGVPQSCEPNKKH